MPALTPMTTVLVIISTRSTPPCNTLQITRILIRTGADINFISHSSSPNDSALHFAVDQGGIEIVKLLIEAGATVNRLGSSDQDLYSVLQWAARCGNTEIIELLLSAGAQVSFLSRRGGTVIYEALSGHGSWG